jgi:hypothetical protein
MLAESLEFECFQYSERKSVKISNVIPKRVGHPSGPATPTKTRQLISPFFFNQPPCHQLALKIVKN